MDLPRRKSATVFLTLAELAWLILFGLFLAYHKDMVTARETAAARDRLERENGDLMVEVCQAFAENGDLTKQVSQQMQVITNLTVRTNALEKLLRIATNEVVIARSNILWLEAELKISATNLALTRATNEVLQAQLKSAREELKATKDKLEAALARESNLAARLKAAEANLAAARTNISRLAAEKKIALANLDAAKLENSRLEARAKSAEAELQATKDQLATTRMALLRVQQRLKIFDDRFGHVPTNQLATYLDSLVVDAGKWRESATRQPPPGGKGEATEFSIRRDLIGLPTTDLNRVIFVVDTSKSLSGPWESQVKPTILTWVEHLPIKECVVVSYNNTAEAFPTRSGNYHTLRVDGKVVPEKRRQLLDHINLLKPGGNSSQHEKGLGMAYSHSKANKPDLIVLFSDGLAGTTGQQTSCETLAETNRIPVFVVAVGNYDIGWGKPIFPDKRPLAFLKTIAELTGGGFVAR